MEKEVALRLLVAVLLAVPLGWDRERKNRPAGLRTHMLVAMSSALLTAIAEVATADPRFRSEGYELDPLRVLQATATGVSLLCAGTVVVSKRGGVQGLTTAASIWTVSAMGCATGLGYYLLAGVCVALALLILVAVGRLEESIPKDGEPPEGHALPRDG
jgi:putative Mg2+ transporter-C (MgtC) family protein